MTIDIDAARRLCEPSTNIDLASHEHFLMLQRNLRRALDEIAELHGEVERLRILDGDREQLEQDCEAYDRLKERIRIERDDLRAQLATVERERDALKLAHGTSHALLEWIHDTEKRTAERIAAWLESPIGGRQFRDAERIRAGAWRTEGGK